MIWNHHILTAGLLAVVAFPSSAREVKPKLCSAPQADLSKPIIWGAQCKVSDDLGLAFGGCEQAAAAAHTRVLMAGKWLEVHDDLRKANPLQPLYDPVWSIRDQVKDASATARSIYFGGAPPVEQDKAAAADLAPALEKAARGISDATAALKAMQVSGHEPLDAAGRASLDRALARLADADRALREATATLKSGVFPDAFKALWNAQVVLEQATESLDAEPAPRRSRRSSMTPIRDCSSSSAATTWII